MSRIVFAPAAVVLCTVLSAPTLGAQTKSAAQAPATKAAPAAATAAPPAPAKFVKPIKGTATVDYFIASGPTKSKDGKEIVTVIKIRNTSAGAISLFTIDEYWYDKGPKPKVVTGDTCKIRKPFNPGEIETCTLSSPVKPNIGQNQYQFSHVNGDVKPTKVTKKF
jgi:hypothetical protein